MALGLLDDMHLSLSDYKTFGDMHISRTGKNPENTVILGLKHSGAAS